MLTLQQIQERAYATAKSKGWHDRPLVDRWIDSAGEQAEINHDRVLAKHALIHTELTEALAAYADDEIALYLDHDNGGKPEGMLAELADVVIRIADTTAALGIDLASAVAEQAGDEDWLAWAAVNHWDDTPAVYIDTIRRHVDQATESARVDDWDLYASQLGFAVLCCALLSASLGHDLGAAIAAKMDYNETRPHRHGGKQA